MIGMGVCRVCSFQKEIDQVGKDDSIVEKANEMDAKVRSLQDKIDK